MIQRRTQQLVYALALAALAALLLAAWALISLPSPTNSVKEENHAPDTVQGLSPQAPDIASPDPVEKAVAQGEILDTKTKLLKTGEVERTMLARTPAHPRLVRVVEVWKTNTSDKPVCTKREMFLADQLIIRVAPSADMAKLKAKLTETGITLGNPIGEGLYLVQLPTVDLEATSRAMAALQAPELAGLVEHAEPDGIGFAGAIPNDTDFGLQWGLRNTGQFGTSTADISAVESWDILTSTPGIVIAVLDSGMNLTHPDLQNVAWVNPGEIAGDGRDNDANGYVDDINGYDFPGRDTSPTDDSGHGTHVTGIIAATRNNGIGVAGILTGAKIMVAKVLNGSTGTTSDLILGTTYARRKGATIMNMSLQSYPYSNTLATEFNTCQNAGITLVICAGNQGGDNDVTPNYPSSYTNSNIIAVGNHGVDDTRYTIAGAPSNYGKTSVDLFAPGQWIYSTLLGTTYGWFTGTSMATPHVAAVCGALKYLNPTWSASQIKSNIMTSVVTHTNYTNLCVGNGRLDMVAALGAAARANPSADTDTDGFSNLFEYLAGTELNSTNSKPVITTGITNGFFRVGIPKVARADAHFRVEMSTNLTTWTNVGITDFSTAETLAGGLQTSGANKGFLRIKALGVPGP
jgi:hypothetical protein